MSLSNLVYSSAQEIYKNIIMITSSAMLSTGVIYLDNFFFKFLKEGDLKISPSDAGKFTVGMYAIPLILKQISVESKAEKNLRHSEVVTWGVLYGVYSLVNPSMSTRSFVKISALSLISIFFSHALSSILLLENFIQKYLCIFDKTAFEALKISYANAPLIFIAAASTSVIAKNILKLTPPTKIFFIFTSAMSCIYYLTNSLFAEFNKKGTIYSLASKSVVLVCFALGSKKFLFLSLKSNRIFFKVCGIAASVIALIDFLNLKRTRF